jgi:uncharacterized protein involved in exopolysaccharide biosynthesis
MSQPVVPQSSGESGAGPDALGPVEEPVIRPLALVNVLLRQRWTVFWVATVSVVVVVVSVLLAEPVFTSTAKFIPSSARGVTSRMGAIAGPGNPIDLGGDTSSADYFIALVESPSFLEKILVQPFTIASLGRQETLLKFLDQPGATDRERMLRSCEVLDRSITMVASKAAAGSSGPRIITLTVMAAEPQLSADIAKAVLAEIVEHNQTARNSKAVENRTFVQKQLLDADKALAQASDALATFMARNRKIATPEVQGERDRLERQRRMQEEVFITLTKQLELARIEEQENRVSIEVLQPPEAPLNRSSPRRTQSVLIAGFVGLMLGCLAAFVRDRLSRVDRDDPETRDFLDNLRSIRGDLRRLIPFGSR